MKKRIIKVMRRSISTDIQLYVLYVRRLTSPGSPGLKKKNIPFRDRKMILHSLPAKKSNRIPCRVFLFLKKSTFFPDIPYRKSENARESGRLFFAFKGEKIDFSAEFIKKTSQTAAYEVCCPPIRAPPRCCVHPHFKN